MPIQTRAVLAACYLGPNKGRTMLTHACDISADGTLMRVLCGRVSELSIADEYADDIHAEPTCRPCRAKLKKLRGERLL